MLKYDGKTFLKGLIDYDCEGICYNLDYLDKILKTIKLETSVIQHCRILFAVKANYDKRVLRFMSQKIDGFDCASAEEFRLIENFDSFVSCVGLSFTSDDIATFMKKNIYFDFSSYSQFLKFEKSYPVENIGIRVRSTEKKTRFGFTDVEIGLLADHDVIIDRIHFHYGDRSLESFTSELMKIKTQIQTQSILKTVKTINVGGSFEKIFANKESRQLMQTIEKFRYEVSIMLNHDVEIIIEPGDLLVRPIGFIKSSVIDQNEQYIAINTSSFNISSWYPISRVYYKNKFLKLLSESNESDNVYHLVGKSCNEFDNLIDIDHDSPLDIGSSIIFFPAGSYKFYNPYGSIHGFKENIFYFVDGRFCNGIDE